MLAAVLAGICLTGCAGTNSVKQEQSVGVSVTGDGGNEKDGNGGKTENSAANGDSGTVKTGGGNSGTENSETGDGLELTPFGKELLDQINKEHEAVMKPQVSVEDYISQYSDTDFDRTEYSVDMSSNYGADFVGDTPLTIVQAKEDLDVLFQALQTTYGAYYYFGGDEVFNEAKAAVTESLEKIPEEKLTCNTLVKHLLKELSFIKDGHFRIVGMATADSQIPYFYKETAFKKTENGFTAVDTGKNVFSIDGWENLEDLMKRSLSEDGQVIYYPVVLKGFSGDWEYQPENLTVYYDNGSTQTLTARKYESFYDQSSKVSEFRFADENIPFLFVRSMGFDEAEGDTVGTEFLSYLEQAKEEPVIIVDLRSNGGGNSILPFKWLNAYTGSQVTTNYVSIKYWSREDMEEYAENTKNPYYVSYESMTEIAGYTPVSGQYTETNGQPDHFTDNDKLLIILTGKNTASAAETFVDMAHNVRNTIIIGENTYGVLVSNAYTVIALPNSHTPVQFGSDLSIFPEDSSYFQEFRGLQPDFWTEGKDAEKMAVALVKRLRP